MDPSQWDVGIWDDGRQWDGGSISPWTEEPEPEGVWVEEPEP